MKCFFGALAGLGVLAGATVLPSPAFAQVLLLQQPVIHAYPVVVMPAVAAVPTTIRAVEVRERIVWVPQRVREHVVVDRPAVAYAPVVAAVPVAVAHGTWVTRHGATVVSSAQVPAHWIWTLD